LAGMRHSVVDPVKSNVERVNRERLGRRLRMVAERGETGARLNASRSQSILRNDMGLVGAVRTMPCVSCAEQHP